MTKRYFKMIGDDDPPGLWTSNSNPVEVERLLAAFKKTGIEVEEINAAEARRIQQQQHRADVLEDLE